MLLAGTLVGAGAFLFYSAINTVAARKSWVTNFPADTREHMPRPQSRSNALAHTTMARLPDGAGDLKVRTDEYVVRPADVDLVDCVRAVGQL